MEVSLEKVVSCPICSGLPDGRAWTNRDRQCREESPEFTVRACEGCKAFYLETRCVASDVGRFYSDAFYTPYQATDQAPEDRYPHSRRRFGKLLGLMEKSRADRLLFFVLDPFVVWPCGWLQGRLLKGVERAINDVPRDGHFLDYGCGNLAWLRKAREIGFRTSAVDFNPNVVKRAREDGHEALTADEWLAADIADESYDFIRMNHVIEHLYDPRAVLTAMSKRLTRGGVLHIATPNPQSWTRRVFGRHWWGFDYPRHIVLFPPRTLKRLLSSLGLTDYRLYSDAGVKDAVRSVGAWDASRGWYRSEQVVHGRHDGFFSRLFSVPTMFATPLHATDQYTLLASRPPNRTAGTDDKPLKTTETDHDG